MHARLLGCRASDTASGAEQHGRHDPMAFGAGSIRADLVDGSFRQQRLVDHHPHVDKESHSGNRVDADFEH
jgi:hypothetical protein